MLGADQLLAICMEGDRTKRPCVELHQREARSRTEWVTRVGAWARARWESLSPWLEPRLTPSGWPPYTRALPRFPQVKRGPSDTHSAYSSPVTVTQDQSRIRHSSVL